MKSRSVLLWVVLAVIVAVAGCGRRPVPLEDQRNPEDLTLPDLMSMDYGGQLPPMEAVGQYQALVNGLAANTSSAPREVVTTTARIRFMLKEDHGIETSCWDIMQGVYGSISASAPRAPYEQWAEAWVSSLPSN